MYSSSLVKVIPAPTLPSIVLMPSQNRASPREPNTPDSDACTYIRFATSPAGSSIFIFFCGRLCLRPLSSNSTTAFSGFSYLRFAAVFLKRICARTSTSAVFPASFKPKMTSKEPGSSMNSSIGPYFLMLMLFILISRPGQISAYKSQRPSNVYCLQAHLSWQQTV